VLACIVTAYIALVTSKHRQIPNFFFGWADRPYGYIQFMFDCTNYVTKIMSKSPSRHLVKLQRNMKPTEKIYIFASFYYVFQYSNVQVISRFQWLI